MPMSKIWYIYCHTTPNGKRYIGQTSKTPEKRWSNGNNYRSCRYFNRAISKYGWDNIKHEILCLCHSKKIANLFESHYIKKFDSNNPMHGYNLTTGGEGTPGVVFSQETIEKFRLRSQKRGIPQDVSKKMLESKKKKGYKTRPMTDDEKYRLSRLNKSKSEALKKERADNSKEYAFSKERREKIRQSNLKNETIIARKRSVLQVDSNGEIVGKYESITSAAKEMGVTKTAISLACRGKCNTAAGYSWMFEDDKLRKNAEQSVQQRRDISTIGLPVVQLDLDGKEVARFNSTVDAGKKTGFPRIDIAACCRGRRKTSHGYIWKYVTEEPSVASIEYSSTS